MNENLSFFFELLGSFLFPLIACVFFGAIPWVIFFFKKAPKPSRRIIVFGAIISTAISIYEFFHLSFQHSFMDGLTQTHFRIAGTMFLANFLIVLGYFLFKRKS